MTEPDQSIISRPQPQPPAVDADFSLHRPRPTFRIDDDVFYGKVEIPALVAMKFATRAGTLDDSGDGTSDAEVQFTLDMLRMMLQKDSADLLIDRLNSEDNPIGVETFGKLVPWLMEQYGMRPTEPSPDSPNGSPNPDGGTNSTANSPPTELTSSTSP